MGYWADTSANTETVHYRQLFGACVELFAMNSAYRATWEIDRDLSACHVADDAFLGGDGQRDDTADVPFIV